MSLISASLNLYYKGSKSHYCL